MKKTVPFKALPARAASPEQASVPVEAWVTAPAGARGGPDADAEDPFAFPRRTPAPDGGSLAGLGPSCATLLRGFGTLSRLGSSLACEAAQAQADAVTQMMACRTPHDWFRLQDRLAGDAFARSLAGWGRMAQASAEVLGAAAVAVRRPR